MNKVFMIGNLTKDPDLRSTGNGVSVCSFRIAVNRRFPNQAGERVSDFFDVVAWRQLADVCGKYLAKGRKVAVVGELQTRTYDAKDGTKRYVTEIIADDVEFLTPRNQDGGEGGFGGRLWRRPAPGPCCPGRPTALPILKDDDSPSSF